MGIFSDIGSDFSMGLGLKDRDDDYYDRTAQTLGRTQGADREAQYRSSMGFLGDNPATVSDGGLDRRGGLFPFIGGGGSIGAIAREITGGLGKGGGRIEAPDVRKYEEGIYGQRYNPDGTFADDSNASLFQVFSNMPYSNQSTEKALEQSIRPRGIEDGRYGYRGSAAHKTEMLRRLMNERK